MILCLVCVLHDVNYYIVNVQGGRTAVIHTARWAKNDCLKLLVDSGGDINVRDNVSDMFVMMLSVTPLPITSNWKLLIVEVMK